jgi:hypothetical protein
MLIPFGEWRPDMADYQTTYTRTAQNVVPRGDGYGPWPAFLALTAALSSPCRGFFVARNSDGSVSIFAGTATKLYELNNTSFTWTDVSAGGASYAALSATAQWTFVQFNNFVIACQGNAAPQAFDLTASSAFAALGGSPPQAAYVTTVNRFLVLSGIIGSPYRIQWSGLNAITTWTSGVSQSDFQDLADGGRVQGVAGGEYGLVFQDAAIRRMTYAPGSPYTFQIDRIAVDNGLLAPYSLTRASERVFFLGTKGFHFILPGGVPAPMGKERFDRFFLGDYDSSNIQLVIGASDPQQSRVYFAYKSSTGALAQFDKILCYDYALDRASLIIASGEFLATLAQPGLTLENLDSIQPNIELFPIPFDSISTAALTKVAAVSSAHALGFFNGANLDAQIDSAEQSLGRRVRVKGFRPITDAAGCYGSVAARENTQSNATYSAEQAVNARGLCPANVSTRLARAHLHVPAGTTWTYATGVEPAFQQEGRK